MRSERNTVDVRGLRVHEAEAALEARTRAANGPVWAIQGIGTGKPKRGLRGRVATVCRAERVGCALAGRWAGGGSVQYVN